MCAIFGVGFLKGHTICNSDMVRDIIRELFLENMARGHTASGIAYCSSGDFKVIKTNLPADRFINLPEYDDTETKYMTLGSLDNESFKDKVSKYPPLSVIGHCRLKTKGSELVNDNNHPIVRDEVVGVHNGQISNDDKLFDLYSKAFKRNGKVDSEIIFALIEYFSKKGGAIHTAIQKASSSMQGSFACAMAHKMQPYVVWLFRRVNPCDVVLFKDVGMVIWSSNKVYITNATRAYPALGKGEIIALPPDSGIGIDLYRNKIHRFELENYHYDNQRNAV